MNSSKRPPLSTDQVAAYAYAAAAVLDIGIPTEYRAGVIANLERLLAVGDQVMGFPLPEDIEAAPVFRP